MLKNLINFFKGATSIGDVISRLQSATQSEVQDVVNKLPKPAFDLLNVAVKTREVSGK